MASLTSVIRDIIWDVGAIPDKFSQRGGVFTWKRAYFYRHGESAGKYAAEIVAGLAKSGIRSTIVEAYDDYHNWPTTSYFVVRFKIV